MNWADTKIRPYDLIKNAFSASTVWASEPRVDVNLKLLARERNSRIISRSVSRSGNERLLPR